MRALLDRAMAPSPAGEPVDSTARLVFNKLDLGRFVDDLSAAPATWPVPLPLPGTARWWPDRCLATGALPATDLLVAAAHLQHGADQLDDGHPLRPELAAAADRLLDAGLTRLAERAKHEAKHQAKHQAATSDLRSAQIILAKHQ